MRIRKDSQLVRQVKVLFRFRNHVAIYVIAILLMWLIWVISGGRKRMLDWPFYIAIGWGAVLLVHFIVAYRRFSKGKTNIKHTNTAA